VPTGLKKTSRQQSPSQGVRCVSGLVQDGRLLVPNTKLILDFQLLNTLADCWYQTPNSFWTQQLNRGGRLLCYQTPNSFWTFILNQGGRLSVSNYKLVLNHDGGRLLVPNSKPLLDIHIKRRWSNVGTKLDLHFQVFNQGGRLLVPNYKLILDFKENISL